MPGSFVLYYAANGGDSVRGVCHYIENHRGQAMVEMALVLPVLLLLAAGTMEFGRVLHQYLVVTAAAREGARTAAVGQDDAAVISAVQAAAAAIDKGQMQIVVSPANRVRGNAVTVSVSNPVPIFAPLVSSFFPQNPYLVEATAIMRVE